MHDLDVLTRASQKTIKLVKVTQAKKKKNTGARSFFSWSQMRDQEYVEV